jgi:hypothetical protein
LKKKRKYGDLAAQPSNAPDPVEFADVYERFTGRRPAARTPENEQEAAPPTYPSLNESLSPDVPLALQNESLMSAESLPRNDSLNIAGVNLWASVPEIKGHCRWPHALTDSLFKLLDVPERVVYEQLFRLSWGFGKDFCTIGLPKLAERSGLKPTATHGAVARLTKKGLVIKAAATFGKNKEQGITYRLPLPEWLVRNERLPLNERHSPDDSNKLNTQKENTQTQDAPPAAVRAGSKFTIEECRRYAEHLRSTGQGINNPGGYATTIKRTGEADLLIENFLHPEMSPASSLPDASECPDCGGSGFKRSVTGKGVTKCKHERLGEGKAQTEASESLITGGLYGG